MRASSYLPSWLQRCTTYRGSRDLQFDLGRQWIKPASFKRPFCQIYCVFFSMGVRREEVGWRSFLLWLPVSDGKKLGRSLGRTNGNEARRVASQVHFVSFVNYDYNVLFKIFAVKGSIIDRCCEIFKSFSAYKKFHRRRIFIEFTFPLKHEIRIVKLFVLKFEACENRLR